MVQGLNTPLLCFVAGVVARHTLRVGSLVLFHAPGNNSQSQSHFVARLILYLQKKGNDLASYQDLP